jgi:hypothetical protein
MRRWGCQGVALREWGFETRLGCAFTRFGFPIGFSFGIGIGLGCRFVLGLGKDCAIVQMFSILFEGDDAAVEGTVPGFFYVSPCASRS